jgi:hypothetical protein
MHTQEIRVSEGRPAIDDIRLRLFAFPEVLDVLATSSLDSLVVVVAGRARPAEWGSMLRAAGYAVQRTRPSRRTGPVQRTLAGGDGRSEHREAAVAPRTRRGRTRSFDDRRPAAVASPIRDRGAARRVSR